MKKQSKKVYRVMRLIFEGKDYQMLTLIATRLHNEFRPIDKTIEFTTSGGMVNSRLEVRMVENTQLLKFVIHSAKKYKAELKPYFSHRNFGR